MGRVDLAVADDDAPAVLLELAVLEDWRQVVANSPELSLHSSS